MKWDKVTIAAAVPVAAVAVFAAVQSYSHIEALALAQHQPLADARMLPLSVDFLIVAGSVILLAGYWLGWLGVTLGIIGTVFANVESGLPYGPLAATIAAWPGVAFTVASFLLERWIKRQVSAPDTPADTPDTLVSEGVSVPSIRQLMKDHGVGQPKARQIQQQIRAGYNGHALEENRNG